MIYSYNEVIISYPRQFEIHTWNFDVCFDYVCRFTQAMHLITRFPFRETLLFTFLYKKGKMWGVLAIRRVFSLVGHYNKNIFFQIVQMFIKSKDYGSKIYSLNIQIHFKAVHILKAAKTSDFHWHPSFYMIILGTVLIKLWEKILILLRKIKFWLF